MNKPTILLVDDDLDDQYFFIAALRKINGVALFDVVNNGKEAIDRLRQSNTKPTLMFMDINMPVMNGIECLSEMAKDPLINSVPVVMLSSSSEREKQARELGAKAFITKQYNIEKLRQKVEQMLHMVLVA